MLCVTGAPVYLSDITNTFFPVVCLNASSEHLLFLFFLGASDLPKGKALFCTRNLLTYYVRSRVVRVKQQNCY